MSVASHDAATVAPPRRRTRRPLSIWRRFARLPGALRLGLTIYAAAIALAIVGAVMLDAPNEQDLNEAFAKPGSDGHLLGTDALGRDVLSWIAHSVPTSFAIAVAVVTLSVVTGTLIGAAAGYVGGAADALLMRVVDLQLAIPPLLLFIAASATVGHGMVALIVLISAVSWVPYARVVRTQVQLERGRACVAAARLAGVSRTRLLTRYLLPPATTVVLVLASVQVGFVLLWEAGLSFIGLGISPPTPSLGFLIAQGRASIEEAWWVVVFPGVMLALLLFASNVVGEGLQERYGVDVEMVER